MEFHQAFSAHSAANLLSAVIYPGMFTDLSRPIAPFPPGRYAGVAVTDVDSDGRFEVVIGCIDGPNRILKWVGGQLRDVAPPTLADPDWSAAALAAADVNGDGREEIYVATAGPYPDRLFAVAPDGSWEDLFARPENRLVRNSATGRCVAALDRRGSGRYGFVVASEEQSLRLYEQTADGLLSDIAPAVEIDRPGDFRHLLPAPIVSYRTDLFGSCLDNSNVLLVQEKDGTFNDMAWRYGLADSFNWGETATLVSLETRFGLVAATMDWDHSFWVPQPDGSFLDRASPALAFPSAPCAVFAADFDNDGAEELLFLNRGEPNRMFRSGPEWKLSEIGALAEPTGPNSLAAVADFDGDGRLELMLASSNPSSVRLFRAAGPDRGWLRILPLTRFAAPARGATVELEADGRTQVRVISGTGSAEPVAHFGLGSTRTPDRVTVTWPDGATTAVPNPTPRQLLRVPYPGG